MGTVMNQQHTEALAEGIEGAVLAAIADGEVSRARLAQIAIAPSDDRQGLRLWAVETWENYPNFNWGPEPIAELPNRVWLDMVDDLDASSPVGPVEGLDFGFTPHQDELTFSDERLDRAFQHAWAELALHVVSALRLVATRQRLGEFDKPVGLLVQGFSRSPDAHVVAFYYPLGALALWPISERREPSDDIIYGWGTLHEQGLTMFYPQGEGDPYASETSPPCHKTYRFEDIDEWRVRPFGSGLTVRLRDDLFDIHFDDGHTAEEWGGPTGVQVVQALLAHFGALRDPKAGGGAGTKPPMIDADIEARRRVVDVERVALDARAHLKAALAGRDGRMTAYLRGEPTPPDARLRSEAQPPPVPVSRKDLSLGPDGATDVAVDGTLVFASAGRLGLAIVDITDVDAPELVSALTPSLPGGRKFYARNVSVDGGVARVNDGRTMWLVDVRDPHEPRSLGLVAEDDVALEQWLAIERRDDGAVVYLVADDAGPLIWCIELHPDRGLRVVETRCVLDEDDEPTRIFDPTLLVAHDEGLYVFTDDEMTPLTRVERASFAPVFDRDRAARQAADWVEVSLDTFADQHPQQAVGAVMLGGLWHGELELAVAAPQTVASLVDTERYTADEDAGPATASIPTVDLLDAPAGDDDDDEKPFARELECDAWLDVARRVLAGLSDSSTLANIASGRLYALLRYYDAATDRLVVDVVGERVDADKPWQPARRDIAGRVRVPLADKLVDWRQGEAIEARAKEDEAVFREVVDIAATGSKNALEIAWNLRELDEDRVVEAIMKAARADYVDYKIIGMLGQYQERPRVRALLDELWDEHVASAPDEWPGGAEQDNLIELARVLGRADDDVVVDLVRALLANDEIYEAEEFACRAMAAMQTRLPDLLDDLAAHVERCGDDSDRLPALYEQMYRAGWRGLPDALADKARGEQHVEPYLGGPKNFGLRGNQTEQIEACRVWRIFAGHHLADRVARLTDTDDRTTPLWTQDAAPETVGLGWRFLVQSVIGRLDERDDVGLDDFEALLIAHTDDEERYDADHNLLEALFYLYLSDEDYVGAKRLGQALVDAAFVDEEKARKLQGLYERADLGQGWQALQSRRLDEARAIADALLDAQPDDPQVRFFDARLTWLEAGSPEAGAERARAHLEALDAETLSADRFGHGRLLNLVGCAYDELARYDEALPYFERAAQAHPDDLMYVANLAEIHDKLGHHDEAYKWAQKVVSAGRASAVCERIVREADAKRQGD